VNGWGGFTGSVNLSVSGLPSGVTATWSTNPTTGTSVLKLAASSSANTNTVNPTLLTITGTSGTLTATIYINLAISPEPTNPPEGYVTSSLNFAAEEIGTQSAPQTLTFTFNTAATLGSLSVLTQGAAGLDFANAGKGSCAANTGYPASQTCTVNVIFTPSIAGTRYGAVVLNGTNGKVIATGYLQGTGVGPQINFLPSTESTVASQSSSKLNNPSAVAVDGSGNVYIADTGNNRILKETWSAGSYIQSTIPTSSLNSPGGVAVDGAGNIYIADTDNQRVLKETPTSGGYTESVIASFPLYSGNWILSVAVDGSGNVYFSSGAEIVYVETLSAGNYTQSNLQTSSSQIGGLAVDGGGNIYVADLGNKQILIEVPSAGGYTESTLSISNPVTSNPAGVAVDAMGNVYIADTGNNRILKETWSAGSYIQSTIPTSSLSSPGSVAADGTGNIYIADTDNQRVLRETPTTGGYTESVIASFPMYSGNLISSVAVDGSGNVYFTSGAGIVYVETLSAGSYTQSNIQTSSSQIGGLAVDGGGNIYIVDRENKQILIEAPSAGGYTESTLSISNPVTSNPAGVAVDAMGNVYIPINYVVNNVLYSAVVKEVLSAGSYTQSTIATSPLDRPSGVAVDGSGNVYIVDGGDFRVLKEDFADPPSLTFATTDVGSTSSDSPQTVTVENTGNAALIFPVLATGNNPSIATNFTWNSSATSACPLVESGSSTVGTLAAGASCLLPVTFAPVSASTLNGLLVLEDNNLNAVSPGYATQSIKISGTVLAIATSTVLSINPSGGTLAAGSSYTLTATVSPSSGSVTPSGNFLFTVGSATKTVALNSSGIATYTGTAPTTAGSLTLSAAYQGTTLFFASNSNTLNETVVIPSFAIAGTSVTVAPGATTANTSTITVTPSGGFTGSVALTATITSSPAGAQYPPTLSFGSTTSVNITGSNSGTAILTVSTTAASIASLANPMHHGFPWYSEGGAALACILLFGFPAQRSRWRTKLGMLTLLITLTGGVIACSSVSVGGGSNPGTTAGAYTITVTGTSGITTATNAVTLNVQ
jgi:streptogramin lyase